MKITEKEIEDRINEVFPGWSSDGEMTGKAYTYRAAVKWAISKLEKAKPKKDAGKNTMPTEVPKKDLFYVTQAAKLSANDVDIENLRINIEMGDDPNETDLHLKNKFGFQIQYVMPGSLPPKEKQEPFNPELRQRIEVVKKKDKDGKEELEPEFKVGEEYKSRDQENLRLFGINGTGAQTNHVMQHLGNMKPNFTISKIAAEINVKHGVWKVTKHAHEKA